MDGHARRHDQRPESGTEVALIDAASDNGAPLDAAHHHVVEDPRRIVPSLSRDAARALA